MATYPGIKYLLVENANYQDIITGKYDTKFSAKAYLASIHTFNHRYGLQMMFMPDPQYSGYFLYGVFTYFLKQKLRQVLTITMFLIIIGSEQDISLASQQRKEMVNGR